MFRMNGNSTSLAVNAQTLGATPSPHSAPPVALRRNRSRIFGRRRDDATFIAIAALLAILFVTQVGWVIGQQPQSQIDVSRS